MMITNQNLNNFYVLVDIENKIVIDRIQKLIELIEKSNEKIEKSF